MTSTTGRGGPGQTPVPGGGKASVHVSAGPPKKQRTDWDLLRYLAQEIAPQRAVFFLAVGLYLPLTAVSVLQPVVLRAAIDDGVARHDLSAVTAWAVVFLLLVCLRAVIEAWQGWVMQGLGQRAVRELRMRLFRKLQRLPMAVFDRVPLGKLMTRVSNDTESLAELFSSGAVSVIGDLFFLVGTLVMLLLVNVELSLSTMATLPFLVVGVQFFRRRARGAFARVRAAVSQMNATLQELLSGMTVVQLFDQVPRAQQRFEADNADYLKANREAIALDAGVYAFVDAVSYVAVALALFAAERIGIVGVQPGGALSLGVLVAFVDALGRFYAPIRELSNKATIFQSALVAADRIIELDEEQETIVAPAAPSPARFERIVSFDDVRFRYGAGPEVLRGLSFSVTKGQRVAVVGHTGAGKSTIIKLLPRLYDVTGGAIRIDDVDIRAMDPRALRKLTTAVPQECFLFKGTIKENLAFGAPDASDERILSAGRACEALDVIERHGGLMGVVAERGSNFSLGERQLLALTRALLCDPPILLLDEATASVDRETERRLQRATETLLAGRTALIVAHRLSTIERSDKIVVIHHGAVVEEGTHDELLQRKGRYAALVELQRQNG